MNEDEEIPNEEDEPKSGKMDPDFPYFFNSFDAAFVGAAPIDTPGDSKT